MVGNITILVNGTGRQLFAVIFHSGGLLINEERNDSNG